ncbi:MAG: hypothetical protein FKY71_17735 [Spiribacter salinus]|uniref:ParB/Sulfiredoxin domain-containing protein n=1 Tax=Spiribacter salinus TaxID=1335746 RepID=A0A540VBX9_9GAMM|nr:MAG: hypothetical protein FKY71_17735 [Spiribacter salinus]
MTPATGATVGGLGPAQVAIAVHSADQMSTGLDQLISGEFRQTHGERLIRSVAPDGTVADGLVFAYEIGPVGGIAAARGIRSLGRQTFASFDDAISFLERRLASRYPNATLRSWVSANEMSFWTAQRGLANPARVDDFVALMRRGEFDWKLLGDAADPAIVYRHGGRYVIDEGHHRFAAALRYAEETGNPGIIDDFLQNAIVREGLPGRTSVDSLVGVTEILP